MCKIAAIVWIQSTSEPVLIVRHGSGTDTRRVYKAVSVFAKSRCWKWSCTTPRPDHTAGRRWDYDGSQTTDKKIDTASEFIIGHVYASRS